MIQQHRVLVDVNTQCAWANVNGQKIRAELDTFAPDLHASGYERGRFGAMREAMNDSIEESGMNQPV